MPVTEGSINVTEGVGKLLDTAIVTTGAGSVHREGTFLGDPETAAARQKVTNADPAGADYGGVVRIAGTVPLPTGAATAARQDTEIAGLASIVANQATELASLASLVAKDYATQTTLAALLAALALAQNSSATSATGPMVQAVVSDTPQSYTTDMLQPLSLTAEGRLRVSTVAADVTRVWQGVNDDPWKQDNPFAMEESLYV